MDLDTAKTLREGDKIRHHSLEGDVQGVIYDENGRMGTRNGVPILLDASHLLVESRGGPETDNMYGWSNRKCTVWVPVRGNKIYWDDARKL